MDHSEDYFEDSENDTDTDTDTRPVKVSPLGEHMSQLLQLSLEQLNQLTIVSDNARLLSPTASSSIASQTMTTTARQPLLFHKSSYSDRGSMMIRKVSPPSTTNTNTFTTKLSRWNDNDKALAAPSCLPRPPLYRPDTTSTDSTTNTTTGSDTNANANTVSNTATRPRVGFSRSTSERSIFQRPLLSMNNSNSNNKVSSRWESSSPMTMTTPLGPSSRQQQQQQRGPSGNSLVRQSSDSALVCPVRMSSIIGASSSSPSIPERRTSFDSQSSAAIDIITDVLEMECKDECERADDEEDGSDEQE